MQFKNTCIPSVLRAGNWRHTFDDDFALSMGYAWLRVCFDRPCGNPAHPKGSTKNGAWKNLGLSSGAGRCSLELLTILTIAFGTGSAGPSTILRRKIRALGGATGSAKMAYMGLNFM